MTLQKYSFDLSTKIEFGSGYLNNVGIEAKELGITKAMIVADKGVIHIGLIAPVEESLKKEGIEYVIFDNILPNPRDVHCVEGAEFALRYGIDGIIAVGGGSSIDSAKAIGTLITNGKKIRDWAGVDLLEKEIPPLIAIPTTAGTGSEVTFDAVITDTDTNEKLNILDKKITPKTALLDPDVLMGLPSHIMASCGIDAMTHAVEAYTCKAANPHTDAFALSAIELIAKNIKKAVKSPDVDSCMAMMLGSTMAGIAFGYSDVAAVHCMAEALGGKYDTPHGVANAVLLSTVTEFNVPSDIVKYATISKYLGVDTSRMTQEEAAYSCPKALAKLCDDVGIQKMRDVKGIDPQDFVFLSKAAERNLSTPNNPRAVTEKEYMDLFISAYEQSA